MEHQEHRKGVMLLLLTAVFEGMFPVLSNYSSTLFPPLFFLGCVSLTAAILFIPILCAEHTNPFVRTWEEWKLVFGVSAIFLTAFSLILTGTAFTSGINTALLLRAEILFTFLVTSIFLHEKLTRLQFMGMVLVLLGIVTVVFNETLQFNVGDILIVGATMLFPFINILAKKALKTLSSSTLLFLRYCIAACVLFPASIVIEQIDMTVLPSVKEHLWFIVVYGLFALTLVKICWYGGLKRIPIGLSIYITSSAPALSLLFAGLFLSEIPTLQQWIGFVISLIGVVFLVRKTSTPPVAPDLV